MKISILVVPNLVKMIDQVIAIHQLNIKASSNKTQNLQWPRLSYKDWRSLDLPR